MPRQRPTTKLGVYGKYDLNPDQAVELYNASRAQNKYFIKEPSWNQARDGLEMTAIVNQRENEEVRQLQAKMRHKAKADALTNERRAEQIRDFQLELRQKYVDVSDFIRECNRKEKIADEKTKREMHVQQEMKMEIETMTKDIACLGDFLNTFNGKVEEYRPYQEILEEVLADTDLYKSKQDLIDRCDALLLAQIEVSEKEQAYIEAISEMRGDMAKTANDATLIMLGLENALLKIQKDYEKSKADCVKWETTLEQTKEEIVSREFLTCRLLDQIQQIYGLFCKRNGEDIVFKRDDVEKQLDYIKEEIETIQEIIQVSKKMMEKESRSDIAQHGSVKNKIKQK